MDKLCSKIESSVSISDEIWSRSWSYTWAANAACAAKLNLRKELVGVRFTQKGENLRKELVGGCDACKKGQIKTF